MERDSGPPNFRSDRHQRTLNIVAVFDTLDGVKKYGHWNPTVMLEDEEGHAKLLTHKYIGILLGAKGAKLDPFFSDSRPSKGRDGTDWKR